MIQPQTMLLLALTGATLTSCQTTETDRDLFLKADSDKDGKLTLSEVNIMGLPRLFGRFDINGDGTVTLAEASQVEPGFDPKVFAERDLNGDGNVSFDEYRQVAERKGVLKEKFAAIDTNRDHRIDQSEAEAYTAAMEKLDASANR
jgi:Ca2+-binding EF-hand superfamily protein